jgi:hypothetical protein
MPDLKITELTALASANLAATDPIAVVSLAGSDTKKITAKDFVQKAVTLIDDASIPSAKVSLSGISGTNLSAGTVAASKLDTSTIPATGGVTVSSSNLQLVAPTSPIVRNAGTGSLEHAVSGVTAGTYTKVTVDSKGHVTVGAAVAAADLPIAISGTVGVMSPGTGLTVTGGGVLNHSSSVTAGTTSGFTYNAQGHITGAVALAGADLPISTSSVIGAVRPGTGLSVDGNGILAVTAATNAALGGVIAGADFSVTTGTISLAAQAGIAAGTYTKLTVNSKGIATAGTVLSAGDIPNIATSQITSGTLSIDRYGANTITGAKLANYSISKISDAFPTADYISQLYFSPLEKTLYMWDGNVYQPIGVSYGQVVFSGTYDAGTNLIASVTTEGAAIGLTVGGALVSPVTATKGHYVVVDQPGTGTAPAPTISLSPPDMLLSNGTTWVLLDVSDTVTAQLASNIQVSPAGNISTTNVQSALQELDDEKLAKAGGTLTGNLALNTGIAIVYEGATTDDFETTLYVVDPTADRTILLPNVSGTVVTTGDTGTVTSTMLLDGTILNEDINASAAIVDTKLATIATAGKVSNSATTAASANTASAIVARDASGNFTAGTITAALTGAASSNVLKAGDTMTGALVHPLGAVGTPSITFTGDLNTGFWSPSADTVAASTAGSERLRITSAGLVGIGSSSPPAALTVVGSAGSGDAGINIASGSTTIGSKAALFFIPSSSPSVTTGSAIKSERLSPDGSDLQFFTVSALGNTPVRAMTIDSSQRVGIGTTSPQVNLHLKDSTNPRLRFEQDNSSVQQQIESAGNFVFTSDVNNVASGGFIFKDGVDERARIDGSGRLLVGTSSTVSAAGADAIQQIHSNNYMQLALINNVNAAGGCGLALGHSRGASAGTFNLLNDGDEFGVIYFVGADGTDLTTQGCRISAEVDGTPGANDMPGRLVFSTCPDSGSSPVERMRITSAGQVRLAGAGITFNGDTAAANELDDYEEGTFTLTMAGSSTAGTVTYGTRKGNYTKIGNLVTARFYIDWSSFTGTGDMRFGGLPFTVSNDQNAGACAISDVDLPTGTVNLAAWAFNNQTYVIIVASTDNGGTATVQCDAAGSFFGCLTYNI